MVETGVPGVTIVSTEIRPALTDLDDATLIESVGAGSAEALEVLYDRHSRIVLSFATRMLQDRQSAEELMQEVFLRAWRQAKSFSTTRGQFVTWLLSITHNLAIDEIRKRNRRPQRANAADPVLLLTNVTSGGPSVEESAEIGHLQQIVKDAIASLPDHQRLAIELAYVRGMTQREIADHLDEPLGTIKTRMRLGMRKMKEYLEHHEVDLA